MIYFLSDLHGDMDFINSANYLNRATEDDLLIILGDVGLNFEKNSANKKFDKEFLSVNKKIAFIDGNHENFSYLNNFHEEHWNGGTVGRLTQNIVHLKRGNIYNIAGKTFFVFGGCKSSAKWKDMGLWYPEELPNETELAFAYENLKKSNYKVDYILTHKYEESTGNNDSLQTLFNFIDKNVEFDRWYCGHWHKNERLDHKHIVVYNNLISIE